MMKWATVFSIIFIAFLISISVPFDLVIAPARKFQVVDENKKLIKKFSVRQHWYQSSLDFSGDTDVIIIKDGKVEFPKRSVKTNLVSLIVGAINQFSSVGIHASYTSNESIGIFDSGYTDKWLYNGKGLEAGFVVLNKKTKPNK